MASQVWDIRNFGCVQSFTPEGERADQLASFAPAPRHKRIVSGGRQLHVFDYERQKNPHLTDDQPIQHALFNPLTMHVMTAGASTVKVCAQACFTASLLCHQDSLAPLSTQVWDVLTGELKKVFRGVVEGDITALTLDGRNCKFLCGTHSGIVSEFTAVNGAFMKDLGRGTDPAHSSEVSGLAYSVRHKCVAATLRATTCNDHHTALSRYHRARRCVVSASWDRTIVVHDDMDNQQGILLRDISHAHTADIACMALSDHLSLIATGAVDGSVHVWDFEVRVSPLLSRGRAGPGTPHWPWKMAFSHHSTATAASPGGHLPRPHVPTDPPALPRPVPAAALLRRGRERVHMGRAAGGRQAHVRIAAPRQPPIDH